MNLLLAGQILKLAAGAAQFAFGVWLVATRPRTAANVWFAIAFAMNGVAYFLFNLARPGQRAAGSLALEGRALFNWIATAAMLAFGATLLRFVRNRAPALVTAIVIGATVLAADLIATRQYAITLREFGGIAIYPATAFVLGLLPFEPEVPIASPFLIGALAINSVDHLGAEFVRPSPTPPVSVALQIAAMAAVAVLWLWRMEPRVRRPVAILVAACFVVPFAAGAAVRIATGSYRGMQQSGLIGAGRIVATCLLVYAARSKNNLR